MDIEEIKNLIKERNKLRKNNRFIEADEIRDKIVTEFPYMRIMDYKNYTMVFSLYPRISFIIPYSQND